MGGEGFEPSKASPADLQSVPFGHSGIHPFNEMRHFCAHFVIYYITFLIFINSDPEETRTLDLRRDRAALQPTEPPGQIKVCTFKTTYMLHPNGIILQPCDCWSSPHPISNSQLRALLHFHPCPIYLVVFKGSYFLKNGISHLEGGFTLRCLQRLSLPDLATRP